MEQTVMTKRMYANSIVDGFCKMMNLDRATVTTEDWGYYMKYSSKLSVCLEYLNLLSDRDLAYAKCRGGIYDIDPETFKVISVREYMATLPDDEIPEKETRRLFAIGATLNSILRIFREYRISGYKFNINIKVSIDHVNKTVSITDREE